MQAVPIRNPFPLPRVPRRQGPLRGLRTALVAAFLACAGAARPQSCFWSPGTEAPEARFEGATFDIDGRLYVMGGFHPFPAVTLQVNRYDPASDVWTRLGDMPVPITHAPPAVVGRKVYFAGGFQGNHPGVAVTTSWIYDVDQDSWAQGQPLPIPVAGGGLVHLAGKLHYISGVLSDRNTTTGDHWVLDLAQPANGWSAAAPLPVPRDHLSAVALNGRIYVLGGQERHDTNPVDYDLVHVYDPTSDSWSEQQPMPFSRSHAEPGTFSWQGKIVLTGGKSSSLGLAEISDVSLYDPTLDGWSSLPALPVPRLAPSARVLGGKFIATCGGSKDFTPEDDTFLRDESDLYGNAFRINLGGSEYLATDASVWCVDQGTYDTKVFTNDQIQDILGTDDDPLYKCERYANASDYHYMFLRVPVPPGDWRVRLHFAEIYFGAPGGGGGGAGQRVFDVAIEDEQVLDDYDTYAAVGSMRADVHAFDLEVADISLEIDFLASVGRPKLNALELLALPPDTLERYCSSGQNSTGGAARIRVLGTTSVTANDLALIAAPVPDQPGIFFYGPSRVDLPFGNGRRCVGGLLERLPVVVASGNQLRLAVDNHALPQGGDFLPGVVWNFQAWFRDPSAGGAAFDLSDAIGVRFTP